MDEQRLDEIEKILKGWFTAYPPDWNKAVSELLLAMIEHSRNELNHATPKKERDPWDIE